MANRRTRRESQPPATLIGNATVGDSSGEQVRLPEAVEPVVRREGSAPGQSRSHDRVCARLYQPETNSVVVPVDALPQLVTDDRNFVWVDLSGYGEDDVRQVGELLELHPHALHAIRSPWRRPSLNLYPDHFLVSTTVARLQPGAYRVLAGELDLVVGRNVLVSAHKLPLPFADQLLARAEHSPDLMQFDSAYMLYIVLDELVAYYEELNRHVQLETEQLEEGAVHQTSEVFLARLLHFKRYVFAVAQLADQHRDLFAAFLRPDFRWVGGDHVEIYFRDLDVRFSRLLDALRGAQEAVNAAFDIYVSHLSHRTNQIIRVLTVFSTLLFSASVLIALFGASLTSSFPSLSGRPLGFGLMLLAVLAASLVTLWGFHRKDWI